MYLSIRDYAAKWGISQATVRRLIRCGRLTAYKLSARCIRVPADAVPAEEPEYKPTNTAGIKSKLKALSIC